VKPDEKPNPMNIDFFSRKRKMMELNSFMNLRQQARLGRCFTLVR
jgi:hypothetical protein